MPAILPAGAAHVCQVLNNPGEGRNRRFAGLRALCRDRRCETRSSSTNIANNSTLIFFYSESSHEFTYNRMNFPEVYT